MSEAQGSDALPGSALWMIRSLEGQVRTLAERITTRVQSDIPEFDGPSDGKRHALIFSATHNAMRLFVDRALGRQTSSPAVDDMFRRLGYQEAVRGHDREAIEHALQVAVSELWDELRVRAADNELSAGALNSLNSAVTDFIQRLTQQVGIGYDTGFEERNQDSGVARARLIERLLTGADFDEIERQALIAGWTIPEQVTVMAIQLRKGQSIASDSFGPTTLTKRGRDPQFVVCPTENLDGVVSQIQKLTPQPRVAVCWPVQLQDVPSAWRWVNRALSLVKTKVIPARPVIECVRHRTEIWLHAEPVLRRQLVQELLHPLLDEPPNSRDILSQTLLVWLETRDSAPAIAARLGVHPQTVRYRWKRINDLFGEALHDPEFVVQLTMLLKASVPLWVAGDQSDFERFQAGTGG